MLGRLPRLRTKHGGVGGGKRGQAHYDIAQNLIMNAKEMGKSYVVQDLDLNNCSMLWRLQTVSNIIADPNTAMIMFKDCIYSQFDGKQKFPPMYKPEIIK